MTVRLEKDLGLDSTWAYRACSKLVLAQCRQDTAPWMELGCLDLAGALYRLG